MGFFLATSRSAERMFADTKVFLKRNPKTRIDLLEALVALKDIPSNELAQMWIDFHEKYHVRELARSALKQSATGRSVDDIYLQKLLATVARDEEKLDSMIQEAQIKAKLTELQILEPQANKYLKRDLQKAFTSEEL